MNTEPPKSREPCQSTSFLAFFSRSVMPQSPRDVLANHFTRFYKLNCNEVAMNAHQVVICGGGNGGAAREVLKHKSVEPSVHCFLNMNSQRSSKVNLKECQRCSELFNVFGCGCHFCLLCRFCLGPFAQFCAGTGSLDWNLSFTFNFFNVACHSSHSMCQEMSRVKLKVKEVFLIEIDPAVRNAAKRQIIAECDTADKMFNNVKHTYIGSIQIAYIVLHTSGTLDVWFFQVHTVAVCCLVWLSRDNYICHLNALILLSLEGFQCYFMSTLFCHVVFLQHVTR